MKCKKNILITGLTGNIGGVESVVNNYVMSFPSDVRSNITFLFFGDKNKPFYRLVEEEKLKFVILPSIRSHPILHKKELGKFFKRYSSDFSVLWDNRSNLSNIECLKEAQKIGIKKRIIHCHNSRIQDKGILGVARGVLHYLNRLKIKKYANVFFTCNKNADLWFFGKSVPDKEISFIPNSIKVEHYFFNEPCREKLRNRINVTDGEILIGFVGRLSYQKNPIFAVKVLKELERFGSKWKLVFIGGGEEINRLKKEVLKERLFDKVIFIGPVTNANEWYSAIDILVMPSLFEGFPMSAVEAQVSGLPCVLSKTISGEVAINDNVSFEDISSIDDPYKWAVLIRNLDLKRKSTIKFDQSIFNLNNSSTLFLNKLLRDK